MDPAVLGERLNIAAPYEAGLPESSSRTASHYSRFMKGWLTEFYNLPKEMDIGHIKPRSQTRPGEWIPRLILQLRSINRAGGRATAIENSMRRLLGPYSKSTIAEKRPILGKSKPL